MQQGALYDCVVVGGGPGGLVSALYLRRYHRKILVINADRPRAYRIPKIHNLLASPQGMSGRELLQKLHQQLKDLKTEFQKGEATVHPRGALSEIKIGKRRVRAKKVILATGIKDE